MTTPPSGNRSNSGAIGPLSPEQLLEILELLKGSNSVELKLMVADSQRSAITRLGFDPVNAEPRQVYFFDTPDLALNKAGLIVRARRSAGDKADTVVKLRPIDPAQLDANLKRNESFKIEVDAMPGGYVCSASAKGRCSAQEVFDVCDGKLALGTIFSKEQREFFAAHAPAGVKLGQLVPLGPTFTLRVKHQPKSFDRPVVVELWLYPDGSRVLEISTKGLPAEAFQLGIQFRAFLARSGLEAGSQAATKTNSALRYFSKHINIDAKRSETLASQVGVKAKAKPPSRAVPMIKAVPIRNAT